MNMRIRLTPREVLEACRNYADDHYSATVPHAEARARMVDGRGVAIDHEVGFEIEWDDGETPYRG